MFIFNCTFSFILNFSFYIFITLNATLSPNCPLHFTPCVCTDVMPYHMPLVLLCESVLWEQKIWQCESLPAQDVTCKINVVSCVSVPAGSHMFIWLCLPFSLPLKQTCTAQSLKVNAVFCSPLVHQLTMAVATILV